jgi:hypothetical protein
VCTAVIVACSGSSSGSGGGGGGTSAGGGAATGGGSGGGTATGGGSGGGGGTMGNLPDGGFSACGFPGDKGNDAGVGLFCNKISDCPASAPICSAFQNALQPMNQWSFFCVATCDPCTDVPPGPCGGGATCVCQAPGQCGCVPNSCGALFPDSGVNNNCGNPDAGDGGP